MKRPRRILLASAGEELRMMLDRASSVLADVQVEVAASAEPRALNGQAVACDALLVEVDLQSAISTDSFARLAGATAGRKVIAAARNAQSEDVRRLFRAGAADVLTAPFTQASLEGALRDLLGGKEGPQTSGRVVTMLRASGGAGATTVALNLAALAVRPDRKLGRERRSAAVLDLDLQFGDADLALNLEPRSTLVDILRAEQRFDGRLLQSAMIDHSCGLRLLASPRKVVPLDALTPTFASEIVTQSAELHDYTFVDLPCVWTDWTLPILRQSSLLILLATPTVQGAIGARRVIEALEDAEVETPMLFVLNKLAGMVEAFEKPSRIGKSLNRTVDATLSLDPAATRAFDRGVPLIEAFPNARLTRELRALAAKIEPTLAQTEQRQLEHVGAAA